MRQFMETMRIGYYSFASGIKNRGLIKTLGMCKEAIIDEYYNRTQGLEVSGFYDPKDCEKNLDNKDFANFYQPVRYRPFNNLFSDLDIVPEGRFIDIGSGKGKALVLAAEFGFKKIIGIELFEELNVVARENIKIFQDKNPQYRDVEFEVLDQDACTYEYTADDQIIFMNDPFSDEVMKPFMDQLIPVLKESKHKAYIIYKNNGKKHFPNFYRLHEIADYLTRDYSGNYFEIFKLR